LGCQQIALGALDGVARIANSQNDIILFVEFLMSRHWFSLIFQKRRNSRFSRFDGSSMNGARLPAITRRDVWMAQVQDLLGVAVGNPDADTRDLMPQADGQHALQNDAGPRANFSSKSLFYSKLNGFY